MTRSELQGKIAKMEAGLENPNIQGAAREALEQSLAKAKEQLAGMEEKPAKDVYVSIDKDSGDGKYDVHVVSMSKEEWKAQQKIDAGKGPSELLSDKDRLTTFVGSYDSLPKAIAAAKDYCRENGFNPLNTIGLEEQAKPAPAKPKKAPKKKTPTQPTSAYSWRKKAPVSDLKPIQLTCQHYHLPVTKDTRVSLKRTGASSVVVTARPGDHLIFDDQGYLVFVMEAKSFKRKCTEEKPAAKPKAKETSKPKPKAKPKKKSTTQPNYIKTFDQTVNAIRREQNQPERDEAQLKKELAELAASAGQKNYQAYVERKLKRLEEDGVRISKAEIIRIGIALRPLVQSLRGTLTDVNTTNRKVLAPQLGNLLRWAKDPGSYDLVGVDIEEDAKPTAKAKVPKRVGVLEWLFGG